jgi:hypothetical protein
LLLERKLGESWKEGSNGEWLNGYYGILQVGVAREGRVMDELLRLAFVSLGTFTILGIVTLVVSMGRSMWSLNRAAFCGLLASLVFFGISALVGEEKDSMRWLHADLIYSIPYLIGSLSVFPILFVFVAAIRNGLVWAVTRIASPTDEY